jgi:NADPH-dependent 2,4-dienoyl-CoA reductase/sulfur reductase-like enzyme
MKSPRLLILGNGGAAVHAMIAMRSAGHKGPICLVSDTDGAAFNPMLSPYYLKGKISWNQCFPFGENFYGKYDVTCHFNAGVDSLDAVNRSVFLANGLKLDYDRCLIATGARPILPPIPGLETSSRVFTLRTAAQTRHFESAIGSTKRVVVLGASLIGVKVAEILRQRNIAVILLDVANQILPYGAHPEAAALLKDYFCQKGIDVRLGCRIKGMEDHSAGVDCLLPDNVTEPADGVAVCTGVIPNIDFVDPKQVAVDPGILVNERMETSAEGLYAAGDASQGMNRLTGKKEWLGSWANACYQGRTAGLSMLDRHASYPGSIPQHVSPFFDLTFVQIGDPLRRGQRVRQISGGGLKQGRYHLLLFEDDVLVGVNLLNDSQWASRLKAAVMRRLAWGRSMPRSNADSFKEIEQSLNALDYIGEMG